MQSTYSYRLHRMSNQSRQYLPEERRCIRNEKKHYLKRRRLSSILVSSTILLEYVGFSDLISKLWIPPSSPTLHRFSSVLPVEYSGLGIKNDINAYLICHSACYRNRRVNNTATIHDQRRVILRMMIVHFVLLVRCCFTIMTQQRRLYRNVSSTRHLQLSA
ncbi:hypothetical protein BJ138DRAFT_667780 [Hygrophoropsis aurantiaca]|uniref:Uncharacterized protein n=1 Tax=Hygrophoropsis aurantiaca TaxID=72124 RepID=A0ACB8AJN0_9AGAM|nr:hypothetical protein BJ138DRAFT_667780 [Hygrophoropsis aurantiaca]